MDRTRETLGAGDPGHRDLYIRPLTGAHVNGLGLLQSEIDNQIY